eukprot:Polyplicarium_translucidae@DN41_c0_g1_i2.p1
MNVRHVKGSPIRPRPIRSACPPEPFVLLTGRRLLSVPVFVLPAAWDCLKGSGVVDVAVGSPSSGARADADAYRATGFASLDSLGAVPRLVRPRGKARKKRRRKLPGPLPDNHGLNQNVIVSDELAAIVGKKALPRRELIRRFWEYAKRSNLQSPDDKRVIICDELVGRVAGGKPTIHMFELSTVIAPHVSRIAPPDSLPLPPSPPDSLFNVPMRRKHYKNCKQHLVTVGYDSMSCVHPHWSAPPLIRLGGCHRHWHVPVRLPPPRAGSRTVSTREWPFVLPWTRRVWGPTAPDLKEFVRYRPPHRLVDGGFLQSPWQSAATNALRPPKSLASSFLSWRIRGCGPSMKSKHLQRTSSARH